MLTLRTTLLGGALTAAAAGLAFAGAASAAGNDLHTMNIALPDGAVAQVTYHGAVAPRVTLVRDDAGSRAPAADESGPIAFDGLFAAMEREHAAMMQQAALVQQQAMRQMANAEATSGAAHVVPAGFSYSYVSTTSGTHGCTRTVEWRSDGSGKQPQVIHAVSGDCDAAGKDAAPVRASAPAPAPAAPVKPARGSPA
jgi:hypothetical protein